MEVLISRFITDEDMDLCYFMGTDMQVAFFKRKDFLVFNHAKFFRRLVDHNIRIKSVHAPATDVYHQANNEFMTTLKTIRDTYKVKVITLHPQRGEKQQAKSYYRRLEEEIKEMGIILAYETFEEEAVNNKWISQLEEMHRYFDILNLSFLGITYDFTHATFEKCIDEVSSYNEKIKVIHLSDALRGKPLDMNEYHQHLPLGYGDYRITEFVDLLKAINYRNFIVLEYHPEYDHLLKGDAEALMKYINGDKTSLLELMEARRKNKKSVDI
ncbi:MAG: TIM barrel protein [Spirochaetota bacterium]